MFQSKTIKKYFFYVLTALFSVLIFPDNTFALYTIAKQVRTEGVADAWSIVLGLVNIVAVLGLIIISVAYILRLDLETYDIKRTLPGLVVGVILANFSYFALVELVDLTDSVSTFFLNASPGGVSIGGKLYSYMIADILKASGGGMLLGVVSLFIPAISAIGIPLIIIAALLLALPLLLWLALAFLLYVRFFLIVILLVLSPVAVLLYFIPPGKSIAGIWFDWLIKWLLIGPIVFVCIWVISIFKVQAPDTSWGGFIGGIVLIGASLMITYQIVGLDSISGAILGFFQGQIGNKISQGINRATRGTKAAGLAASGAMMNKAKEGSMSERFWKGLNTSLAGGQHVDDLIEKAEESHISEVQKRLRQSIEESPGNEILRQYYHDKVNPDTDIGVAGAIGMLYAGNADIRNTGIRSLGAMWGDPRYENDQDTIRAVLQQIGVMSGQGEDFYDPGKDKGQQMLNDAQGIMFEKLSQSQIAELQSMAGIETSENPDLIANTTFPTLDFQSQQYNDMTAFINDVENVQAEVEEAPKGELENNLVQRVSNITQLSDNAVNTREKALRALSDYSTSAPYWKSYEDRNNHPPSTPTDLATEIDLQKDVKNSATIISRKIEGAERPGAITNNRSSDRTSSEVAQTEALKKQIRSTLSHNATQIGQANLDQVTDDILRELHRQGQRGAVSRKDIEQIFNDKI